MRKLQVVVAALVSGVLASTLVACDSASERPSIVVTTNILGDVVTQLVGESADVQVLMKPNADPHSFGISAQEAAAMQDADLIVANGLGLEEGLGSNLDNARSEGVDVLEISEEIDPIVYSAGSDEGNLDPHFWTDPARMITAAEIIEDHLVEVIGQDVLSSSEAYRGELAELDTEVAALLESVPQEQRKLVTNHHVFGYLADRFDYEIIGTIIPGGTTLAAPSAADLRDLSTTIRDNNVPAIFADSSQPQRLADVLADEAEIDVDVIPLFTESLTEPDGEAGNYIDMQLINAERISGALS
ncbi:metal ABC transporter substrate-binding protein [Corynebacterium alimapuense]|uniref:Zinc ABC transporter substrate-binding protein n=1 Tax=Corynebacterium alimapuense TaxID=1576874 RepID=A0A3M8K6N3_9CORY|nr:metal ABC transporter substrate-binding protein [Corynebacterium alimapuense]RNE48232.1 zinc ABC transporter substrate-binding protein [Corynebacterium alimapuense]